MGAVDPVFGALDGVVLCTPAWTDPFQQREIRIGCSMT
jgi:hypothetical protein